MLFLEMEHTLAYLQTLSRWIGSYVILHNIDNGGFSSYLLLLVETTLALT